jgi:hypothetical protein
MIEASDTKKRTGIPTRNSTIQRKRRLFRGFWSIIEFSFATTNAIPCTIPGHTGIEEQDSRMLLSLWRDEKGKSAIFPFWAEFLGKYLPVGRKLSLD